MCPLVEVEWSLVQYILLSFFIVVGTCMYKVYQLTVMNVAYFIAP